MPVKHARHISLTEPLAAYVDEQVARGEYASTSDLVRTAIRLLQERDVARADEQTKRPTQHLPSVGRA